MKKNNVILSTLRTQRGKSSFIAMIVFLIFTFVVTFFFSKTQWGFVVGLICSMLSIGNGNQFCHVLQEVKSDMEKSRKNNR